MALEPIDGAESGLSAGQAHWRSRIAFATAVLTLVASGSAWWIEQMEGNPDAFESYGLPLIAAFSAVIALLHRTRVGQHLQLVLLAAGGAVLLERLQHAFARRKAPEEQQIVAAAVTGLTHGFLVLILFPLVGLLLWQALWSVFLNRFGAPVWTIALTGSIVVAWPLAMALPLVA